MARLTLEVAQDGKRNNLVFNGAPVQVGFLQQRKVNKMTPGTKITAECSYSAAGLTLQELGEPAKETKPEPADLIKNYIERAYYRQALDELEGLGRSNVQNDATLLRYRMMANSELGLDAEAENDFFLLLSLPDLRPPDAMTAFERLNTVVRHKVEKRYADWALQHYDAVKKWGAEFIVGQAGVRLKAWPLELLLLEVSRIAESSAGADLMMWEKLVAQLRKVGARDPRVEELEPAIAKRMNAIRGAAEDELKQRHDSRPDFDDVERLFSTKLPSALRQQWAAWYEGKSEELRFIHVRRDSLDDLESTARFVFEEHEPVEGLSGVPGKPHPVFPFAYGWQDSDYFALDLSRPGEGGEFPVLHIAHDNVDGVTEVAATSAEWLAQGAANWDDE